MMLLPRFAASCFSVVAANAGNAAEPFGKVTLTAVAVGAGAGAAVATAAGDGEATPQGDQG